MTETNNTCLIVIGVHDNIVTEEQTNLIPVINRLITEFNTVIHIKHKDSNIHTGVLIEEYNNYIINSSDSAFYKDDNKETVTTLRNILITLNCNILYICGNYLDTTLLSTCNDAVQLGYECNIITDCITTYNKTKEDAVIEYLKRVGVKFISKLK